jgi:hypothetical protein
MKIEGKYPKGGPHEKASDFGSRDRIGRLGAGDVVTVVTPDVLTSHPNAETITVISGSLYTGAGAMLRHITSPSRANDKLTRQRGRGIAAPTH